MANIRSSYVYVMSNHSKTLYVGVTNDIMRRISEHKLKQTPGFTSKYNITMLVYFEKYAGIRDAIQREKQLKGWTRIKKIKLIETLNPKWEDLSVAF